jgi:hypothetical protein
MGRNDDNNRASKCFREYELQAIYMYHKLEIPRIEPSVKEVVLLIARLSEYKYKKTLCSSRYKNYVDNSENFLSNHTNVLFDVN